MICDLVTGGNGSVARPSTCEIDGADSLSMIAGILTTSYGGLRLYDRSGVEQ